jgi:hypothetical protein
VAILLAGAEGLVRGLNIVMTSMFNAYGFPMIDIFGFDLFMAEKMGYKRKTETGAIKKPQQLTNMPLHQLHQLHQLRQTSVSGGRVIDISELRDWRSSNESRWTFIYPRGCRQKERRHTGSPWF